MSVITRQDSNGVKPLLQVGELGYDNFPAGGDEGRVWVGTGTSNIAQAKKSEVMAVDSKVDTHVARDDNPHGVTKAQVGLGNANDTSDADKPISIATQDALDLKANADNAVLTGIPTAPTATVGTDTTQLATTAFVKAEVASEAYSKVELDAGQLDNRYYTETELLNGSLDVRYYTESEIDTKLAAQNDASEINVTPSGNLVSTNVQDALVELQDDIDNVYTKAETDVLLDTKVDDSEIASVNLLRADKYLASQNVVNMEYNAEGKLAKVQYNNPIDDDYEVLSYNAEGKLSNVAHYVDTELKGNTALSYSNGKLVSAPYTAI